MNGREVFFLSFGVMAGFVWGLLCAIIGLLT